MKANRALIIFACALLLGAKLPCLQAEDSVSSSHAGWYDSQGNFHSMSDQPRANYNQPQAPPPTPEQIQQQQEAARQLEEQRQRQAQEARDAQERIKQQRLLEEQQKRQIFEADKQSALLSLKDAGNVGGFTPSLKLNDDSTQRQIQGQQSPQNSTAAKQDDQLLLKDVGDVGVSSAPKQASDSTTQLQLKGLDDSDLQLKDAVADAPAGGNGTDSKTTDDKTAFTKKGASRDLLSAEASGNTALGRAASILPGDASNPILELSLENARAEASKKFSDLGVNAGQFATVVLVGDSGAQAQPVQVPPQVAADPRFQKLVVERDAIQHQVQDVQKKIDAIKVDPTYLQDGKRLTELDKLQTAHHSLAVTVKKDEKYINRMIHLEPMVGLDDDSPPPTPKKTIEVPPPTTP